MQGVTHEKENTKQSNGNSFSQYVAKKYSNNDNNKNKIKQETKARNSIS